MKNIYLFPLYFLMRLIKAVCFWIPISNYKRWKNTAGFISKDLLIFLIIGFISACFLMLNWIVASILIFALIIFFFVYISK